MQGITTRQIARNSFSTMLYLVSWSFNFQLVYGRPPLPVRTKLPSVRGGRLQDEREGDVRCVEQRLPKQRLFHLHKCCLAPLRQLD